MQFGSLSHVLWTLLIDAGVGTAPIDSGSWPVFIGHTPDSPDDAITTYDTTGIKLSRIMKGHVAQREGGQFRVRSMRYVPGWSKGREIVDLVDATIKKELTLDPMDFGLQGDQVGVMIHSIQRDSTLMVLGTEPEGERRRQLFTLNVTALLTLDDGMESGTL